MTRRLTLIALLFCSATGLFVGVADDVVNGDSLVAADLQVTAWFQQHTSQRLTLWLRLFTDAHDTLAIGVLGLAFGSFLAWRKAWYWLQSLVLVLPSGMLLNVLLKQLFQRGRPVFDEPLVALATYSFPSGHVSAATLFYGLLAAYFASRTRSFGQRLALYAAAGLMVVLVAITRIYLGAHFFSDVVAAAAWSTAWLVLCLAVQASNVRKLSARPTQP